MSPGERALLRLRWFVNDAGSRPLVISAVLVLLAVLTAMAASVVDASSDPFDGFRQWVLFASTGFRTEVQLGVVIAAVLLVIDALAGEPFPGQRALLGLLTVVAAAGVVANLGDMIARLSEVGMPVSPEGTTAAAWTVIITIDLAPTVLATVSAWMAIAGARCVSSGRGVQDEL
jgi:hypothetical protein